MRFWRSLFLLVAGAMTCAAAAHSQDAQSLGDAARQARLEKQQKEAKAKDASAKDASSKVPGTDATAKHAPPPKVPQILSLIHIFLANNRASDNVRHLASYEQKAWLSYFAA